MQAAGPADEIGRAGVRGAAISDLVSLRRFASFFFLGGEKKTYKPHQLFRAGQRQLASHSGDRAMGRRVRGARCWTNRLSVRSIGGRLRPGAQQLS